MGAGLQYIDIGGGLGVDYDGSRTNYASSMNYSLAEYASDVVYRIASVCNARGIEHPVIVSESGRAITAHHSVLVFNTLGCSRLDKFRVDDDIEQACRTGDELPPPVRDIFDAYKSISERRLVECCHDALQAREQALQMFNLGYLGLESRSIVERLYWATCAKIRDLCAQAARDARGARRARGHTERHLFLQRLGVPVAAGQLGDRPAVPDHADASARGTPDAQRRARRHHLRLRRQDRPLREPARRQAYARAARARRRRELLPRAFLVGAYQETLGDLHNLFGDTHVVHIKLHDEGGWWIEETVKGDTAAEVLKYMRYDVDRLFPQLARDCERAVREGRLIARREPGAQAVLRVGTERIHVSRAGLTPTPLHGVRAPTDESSDGSESAGRDLRHGVPG